MSRTPYHVLFLALFFSYLLTGCGGGGGSMMGAMSTNSVNPTPTPTPNPNSNSSPHEILFSVNNNLTQFVADALDPTTGAMTSIGAPVSLPPFTSPNPLGNNMVAFTPNGHTAYVVNSATDSQVGALPPARVSILAINASTGQFTVTLHNTFEQNKPTAVVVDPSGRFLFTSTNLNETQIETSPIGADGSLGAFTRTALLPSVPITGMATTTINGQEVLVAVGSTTGFGQDVASYFIRADGFLTDAAGVVPFPGSGAASTFQMDNGNGPPSIPTCVRIAAIGTNSFVYMGSDSGKIFVSRFNPSGTLNSPVPSTGFIADTRAIADMKVATVGGRQILYTVSGGNLQGFALNADGSVGALVTDAVTTSNAISLAIDPAARFAYVGTLTASDPTHSNVVIFPIQADGTLGAGRAVSDGDTSTAGSAGARSLSILSL